MLKIRLLLIVVSAVVIAVLFMLPKAVVENDESLSQSGTDSSRSELGAHPDVPQEVTQIIAELRKNYVSGSNKEKNAIFADSLAALYEMAGKFDSAAWYAEEASKFFNTTDSWIKAGDRYYQAFTFAVAKDKQNQLAARAQVFYNKVLEKHPDNLDVKTKLAMTHLVETNPMRAIGMLREVLASDPENELALFNMGMLSIQSGQHERAVERLEALLKINPNHTQGNLLLGIAWMNLGKKAKAKEQFEKVKLLDNDPSVQATVDSYLKDLK